MYSENGLCVLREIRYLFIKSLQFLAVLGFPHIPNSVRDVYSVPASWGEHNLLSLLLTRQPNNVRETGDWL